MSACSVSPAGAVHVTESPAAGAPETKRTSTLEPPGGVMPGVGALVLAADEWATTGVLVAALL